MLNDNGWLVVIVTNQRSISKGEGTVPEGAVRIDRIVADLEALGARVDGVFMCPHSEDDGCPCKKPKTKLYEDAVRELGIDVARSWVVGDLWRDVLAGQRIGARTVHVISSFRAHDDPPEELAPVTPDITAPNVFEAVNEIMRRSAD